MKYQVLDRIFNKPSGPRKLERLELDSNFHILDTSEQVKRFADVPEEVRPGKDVRLSFPEFIGLEDILISILEGQEELWELKGIERSYENKCDVYIDIYIICEQREKKCDNRLIILIEDVTERMVHKQKFVQKFNETNLLVSNLAAYKNYMDKVITFMADPLLVTTKSGKIKTVNLAAQNLFGYTEDELINKPISLIIDDNSLLQKAIQQRSLFKQYFQNVEVVCRTKNKEKLLIAFSCSVIEKKIEELEDIVYIGRNISDYQRKQQLHSVQYAIIGILSESQTVRQAMPQILQAICESLGWDVGELWIPDDYSDISVLGYRSNSVLRCMDIWSSRAIAIPDFHAITRQTTYTPGVGLPGRVWASRSPEWISDVENYSKFLRFPRFLSVDKRSQPAIAAGLHAAIGFPIMDDSKIFGVMIFLSREVQSPDANLLQMMASIGSQIAQFVKRKRAEEVLLESEARYRDLFENANDLIQCVSLYRRFLYVNRAWRETLGYSESEIANMNVFDIIHPDFQSNFRQVFYRVMSGQKLEQVTTAFVTKDGEKIIVEGNINCKFVQGQPFATRGIFRNITQRVATEEALRYQQQQTESLLLNILPETITNHLKKQPSKITEKFADVTVLFADIVGFTKIASSLNATQLVNLLNKIFSNFDCLSEQYGVEKIKTIGDAYMVVGGLPTRRDDHAQAIAHMALDMQTAIAQFNAENHQNFSIRIGIHSGSVVAGVIGLKKFTYDLWGDTVNVASHMESQGLPGKIQVTQATYERLRHEFLFLRRGEIEIKGKGKMITYLLVDRK